MCRRPLLLLALPCLSTLLFLSALPSLALAYEVKRTPAGDPIRWGVDRITVEVHNSVRDHMAAGDGLDALDGAAGAWTGRGGPNIRLDYRIASEAHHPMNAGVQLVWPAAWEHAPHLLAVTSTRYVASTGEILDADILIRPDADVGFLREDEVDRFDLGAVVTHEMGHVLGLGESGDADAAMWPNISRGQTYQRELASDDIAGIAAIYEDAVLVSPSGCARASITARGATPWVFVLAMIGILSVFTRRRGLSLGFVALALFVMSTVHETGIAAHAQTVRREPTFNHGELEMEALMRHGLTGPVRRAHTIRSADGSLRTRLTIGTEDIIVPGGCHGGVCTEVGVLPPRVGQTIAVDPSRRAWVYRRAGRWTGGWMAPPPLGG
ncbi:MAG: matrixin family metalloprotease [Sandaracinaceae bacterium]